MRKKAGERTLLASVLLSAPGPIVLGAALMVGRSATQLADFIRRTAELGAIIVSWAVYRILNQGREPDPTHQARLERTASSGWPGHVPIRCGYASPSPILLWYRQGKCTACTNYCPIRSADQLLVLAAVTQPEPPRTGCYSRQPKQAVRGKYLSGWVRDSSPGSRLCCPSFRCGCVR